MGVHQLLDRQPGLRLTDQGEHDPASEELWLQVLVHGQVRRSGGFGLWSVAGLFGVFLFRCLSGVLWSLWRGNVGVIG